jgi:hypothetical protein
MSKSEPFPKIDITFSPAWWHLNYGMDFGQALWTDVARATESACERSRLLYERFGDVGMGEASPEPKPQAAYTYGDRFMAAFWGCKIRYLPDQPPAAIVLDDPIRHMETIEVPDVDDSPVVEKAFHDAALLKGACSRASTLAPRSTMQSRSTVRISWQPVWETLSWRPGCCARWLKRSWSSMIR